MNAPWPDLRRSEMPGLRVRMTRQLANHDGPVKSGATGEIYLTHSLYSFEVLIDACGCCGMRRKVTYVNRSDVELVA
jgi:hypothetical protein